MFSKNFYKRINYQINKKAPFIIFFYFFLDRLKHPFVKNKKKNFKKKHQNYLQTKKTTTDYFSINAYYWDLVIKRNFSNFSYLEIGSWEGNSALYILENFQTKRVVCVDIWDLYEDSYKKERLKNFSNFKYNLEKFTKRFSFFKTTSDIYFDNNNEKFDLIYIDGAHESPQVYKDICNSWRVLNKNGIIVCDDYFYGDINSNQDENLPAYAINKFISQNKKNIKIICVNNNQIFFKKKFN
jgi:predicted O-methyltransferase YrrM|tara:strand:+ start:149 stop:868 length:720 start_codon:yes stop_codon:yes gene_type:complete